MTAAHATPDLEYVHHNGWTVITGLTDEGRAFLAPGPAVTLAQTNADLVLGIAEIRGLILTEREPVPEPLQSVIRYAKANPDHR